MTDRRIALLRGINVGTAKRIAMADLRKLVEGLGYGDVRTLLNSGNIVFTVPEGGRDDAAARIEKAIAARLGVKTRVTVVKGGVIAAAVRENPLKDVASNDSLLLVLVPADRTAHARLKPLLKERWTPEALALGKQVAYLWCARGSVDSPLWAAVNRLLGDQSTTRNMATMTKLAALVEDAPSGGKGR